MSYVIYGLDPEQFKPLFEHDEAILASKNIVKLTAEEDDFPCRVSLDHAALGDHILLLNYAHQPAPTPYQSAHAIYVAKGSSKPGIYRNTIPPVLRSRLLSMRAFNRSHMIIKADVVDGKQAEALIEQLLGDPETEYIHVHFAKRGCFAARIERS